MVLKLVVNQDTSNTDQRPKALSEPTNLETIFSQHKIALFRYLLRMVKNEQDALELLQESYTRLLEQTTENSEKLTRSYLFTVALNLARDRARRSASHKALSHDSLDDIELPDAAYGPHEELIWKQGLQRLKNAIKELSPRQQKIFLLRRFKDLSCNEIASLLNISKRTVERELVKTMDHCHKRMKDCLL